MCVCVRERERERERERKREREREIFEKLLDYSRNVVNTVYCGKTQLYYDVKHSYRSLGLLSRRIMIFVILYIVMILGLSY